jgi:hypothetical protein
MINDITWITSFNQIYYDNVAKYNLPTWDHLEGNKLLMVENMPSFKHKDAKIVDASVAYPKDDMHWSISGKKHKFWKKGKCFIWALRNIDTRYLIWLDSDVKVFSKPDLTRFMPEEGQVGTIICGNLKQAESGFVIIDRHHPSMSKWLKEYEEAWYNGIVDTLHRPWDNDVLWYVLKNLPHRNLSKSVQKSPQGFEDTDLLDYMYHYSGKRQKELVRE